jgi:hypothetical protein
MSEPDDDRWLNAAWRMLGVETFERWRLVTRGAEAGRPWPCPGCGMLLQAAAWCDTTRPDKPLCCGRCRWRTR